MKIEEIIKQRKDELNVEHAPPEVWQAIRKDWQTQSNRPTQWWKVAAILFISTSIGLLIHSITLQNRVDELASLSDLSEEYQKLENGYIQQVNQLETSLPLDEIKSNSDLNWLMEELEMLEKINQLYRADIGKVEEDQLVGVLIDYYEKKIRILKKIELEIERTTKLQNNETTTTDNINI